MLRNTDLKTSVNNITTCRTVQHKNLTHFTNEMYIQQSYIVIHTYPVIFEQQLIHPVSVHSEIVHKEVLRRRSFTECVLISPVFANLLNPKVKFLLLVQRRTLGEQVTRLLSVTVVNTLLMVNSQPQLYIHAY